MTEPELVERLTPEIIVCDGAYVPVLTAIAHPPGAHPDSPIRDEVTAVELVTERGSRWFGTSRAWIGSDLRMHLMIDPRDEVRRAWEAS